MNVSLYGTYTDHELALLIKEGDHAAYTEVYNRFFGLLYVHAYRRLNDEDETNDLIQELFASIWDKRSSIELTGTLSAYLYTSIRNRILNFIAHKSVTDKYAESLAAYTDHDYHLADHKVRESDLSKLIEKEISALPATMQKIFTMSRKEHLSYREIATSLDMSEQAVKSQMKRALKILRVKLGLLTYVMLLIKFI